MLPTIFVSIASYRDRLCLPTIQSLFVNAHDPGRVFVGICEQNKKGDEEESCFDPQYKANIRRILLDYRDAKGPTYARYRCSQLYRGEDYFFQSDSHCLFVANWDVKLIRMVEQLRDYHGSAKVLLSTYPREYAQYKKHPSDSLDVPVITKMYVNNNGIGAFYGAEFAKPAPMPQRTYFIAAGFFFTPGDFLKDVPFDPYLDHLFTGEEILLSVRAFTHGWDVFTPNRNIMYHAYTRSDAPKFWDHNTHSSPVEAEAKVKILTSRSPTPRTKLTSPHMIASLATYGLGSVRSKDEFYHAIDAAAAGRSATSPTTALPADRAVTVGLNNRGTPFLIMFIIICGCVIIAWISLTKTENINLKS